MAARKKTTKKKTATKRVFHGAKVNTLKELELEVNKLKSECGSLLTRVKALEWNREVHSKWINENMSKLFKLEKWARSRLFGKFRGQ